MRLFVFDRKETIQIDNALTLPSDNSGYLQHGNVVRSSPKIKQALKFREFVHAQIHQTFAPCATPKLRFFVFFHCFANFHTAPNSFAPPFTVMP